MSWDKRWMDLAQLVATWSKDRSRKVGCVIVDGRNVLVSLGWNGFPRNVCDNTESRYKRPDKYKWTEHAERNAIYNAAANGFKCKDCTLFEPWYPCADCARAIIQSGIKELVCVEPDWNDPNWSDDFNIVKQMLNEANVKVRFVDWLEPPKMR